MDCVTAGGSGEGTGVDAAAGGAAVAAGASVSVLRLSCAHAARNSSIGTAVSGGFAISLDPFAIKCGLRKPNPQDLAVGANPVGAVNLAEREGFEPSKGF